MKYFLTGMMLLLLAASLPSCESIYIEPEGEPADTTVIPIDTIDLPVDSLKIGLIAYYAFSDNSGDSTGSIIDSSGNNYNGEAYNVFPVPNRKDKPNSAYSFTGYDSYIKVNDSYALRLADSSFSINYWISVDEYNASHGSAILHKRGGGSTNGWHASFTGAEAIYTAVGKVGRPSWGVSGGYDPFAVGDKYLLKNVWYMITSLYDADTDEFKIYINGVLDQVTPGIPQPSPATNADLYIGRDSIFPEDGTPPYFLKGKLDDIRIYGRLLSDKEIKKLFVAAD